LSPWAIQFAQRAELGTLKERYDLACAGGRIWSPADARKRFVEYDRHRLTFCHELWLWLYGSNPRKLYSLTAFAWSVTHSPINGGGITTWCLDWSDRRQRVYLGDGLIEYLGLLKDEVERIYGPRTN
jgi:hypothetical protein